MYTPLAMRKIAAVKTNWYGVYKKSCFFGSPSRFLEGVFKTKSDAESYLNSVLQNSFYVPSEFMIEEVEVKMKAWDPTKS